MFYTNSSKDLMALEIASVLILFVIKNLKKTTIRTYTFATWEHPDQIVYLAKISGVFSFISAYFNFVTSASKINFSLNQWNYITYYNKELWLNQSVVSENYNQISISFPTVGYFLVKYILSRKLSNVFMLEKLWTLFYWTILKFENNYSLCQTCCEQIKI